MVFIPQAQPHAQSLFLFPIVFGINISIVWTEGTCSLRIDLQPGSVLYYCIINICGFPNRVGVPDRGGFQ